MVISFRIFSAIGGSNISCGFLAFWHPGTVKNSNKRKSAVYPKKAEVHHLCLDMSFFMIASFYGTICLIRS
jgi:hypothetical protein